MGTVLQSYERKVVVDARGLAVERDLCTICLCLFARRISIRPVYFIAVFICIVG